MKRVCFDTASNFFYDSRNGWLSTPAEAREHFRGKKLRFDAATAVVIGDDPATHDFSDPRELVDFLICADEIVSYNGRKCDLIVLEHAVGEEAMAELWRKCHHDLSGWPLNWFGLRMAVSGLRPDIAPSFDRVLEERKTVLIDQGVEAGFLAGRLADTYRDATFLALIWELYKTSGNTANTFQNGN